MSGTVSVPIFQQDGQQLSFTVLAANTVTLGQVVELDPSTGNVFPATTQSPRVVGVAIDGDRQSRTQTDNQVAAGFLVTVLTRGVANIAIGSGTTLSSGDVVAAYTTGCVGLASAYTNKIGRCLVGGTGDAAGDVTATVLIGQD